MKDAGALYDFERKQRRDGKFDGNSVAGNDDSALEHDRHDAGLPNEFAVRSSAEDGFEKSRLEVVDLRAGIAQPRDLKLDVRTELQNRSARERQKVDAAGGNVFAQVGRTNLETLIGKLVQQLRLDQMNLSQVGLIRIFCDPGTMLHRLPTVGISLHPQARSQLNGRFVGLTEGMGWTL